MGLEIREDDGRGNFVYVPRYVDVFVQTYHKDSIQFHTKKGFNSRDIEELLTERRIACYCVFF